jgi:hypothetical protein
MIPPTRWRDDASTSPEHRELLRSAVGSRPLPKDIRTRSAARIDRLLVVPAAAGLLFWIKAVAAAGLCAVGVVAAVDVVPSLTRKLVFGPDPVRATLDSHPALPRTSIPAAETTGAATDPAVSASDASGAQGEAPVASPAPAPTRDRARHPRAEAPSAELGSGDSLAREAAMLEEARGWVERNPSGALAVLNRHATMFPNGSLSIERELIAVDALRRLGRVAEAQTRGTALLGQARGSIYEERVRALLQTLTSP